MQQNISSYFVPLPLDNLNSSVRVQKNPQQDEENFLDIVHVPEKFAEYQYLQLLSNQDMVPTSTLYPPPRKENETESTTYLKLRHYPFHT